MKMKAPEGVTSAAVESDQYEVDESGHIEVENGEHIPQLEAHGFEQVADADSDTASESEDEIGECPDFSKFVNRQALVDWLVAHENVDHTADEKRADLEAACVAHHALVAAGEARRVHPEADPDAEVEQVEETDETEEVDETEQSEEGGEGDETEQKDETETE